MEIGIGKTSGTIQRLVDKISKEDYGNQIIGAATLAGDANLPRGFRLGHGIAGLTLFDELREAEFSDLGHRPKIVNLRGTDSADAVSLSFEKLFPGAEFVVRETFRLDADHLRWDVRIRKTRGPDRNIRVIQFAPLPLAHYKGWAPIADAPFEVQPYTPFAIDYGQSTAGPVREARWRTTIPLLVFYSAHTNRSVSFTHTFEVPSVRIRFRNNTGAAADFHWNSRAYPSRELPYLQVSSEYLGVRGNKDIETGLLISMHPADWRPALG